MSRFIVERVFPDRISIPANEAGARALRNVVEVNAEAGVTWVHSYVTVDKTKTFDVYDAPDPASIQVVAARNGLPIERITEVTVLDPYFYS